MSSRAKQWADLAQTFKKTYQFPQGANHNWFPGHMARGLRQMQYEIRKMDVIVEVHDARIPFTGRNENFRRTLTGRLPHMLVLNKSDLVPGQDFDEITEELKARHPHLNDVVYTNCRQAGNCPGVKSIIPKCADYIRNSDRYHRSEKPDANVLVIGIPNVGKSSIINALRQLNLKLKGKATAVGNTPGLTQAVLTKIRVFNDPLIYLVDTPGISSPNVTDMHMGMKLAVCATLKDHQVGPIFIVDYLLWYMNRHQLFGYVKEMKLNSPMENTKHLLYDVAIREGMVLNQKDLTTGQLKPFPQLEEAATLFLRRFREGRFGKFSLDLDHYGQIQKPLNINDLNL
eukprot:TCALIF_12591-PA protein Name:"Similar to mtg1 Mitochondrial ribosome-associated GTPase 1 (Ictalurus punctatus)" AED:0.14 eAED:0.14 QI:0/0.75/0.6/1/1/1/5/0/342